MFYPNRPDIVNFIVLGRDRCGSTLLINSLELHPQVRGEYELFNSKENPNLKYSDTILNAFGTEPEPGVKAAGFKVFYYHNDAGGELWDRMLQIPNLRVIHLKRENLLQQAISVKIAQNTNVWKLWKSEGPLIPAAEKAISLPYEQLKHYFEKITEEWATYDALLSEFPTLNIFYHELVSDFDNTFKRIYKFLNLEYCKPEIHLQRQNPEPMKQLLLNYDELKFKFRNTPWSKYFEE